MCALLVRAMEELEILGDGFAVWYARRQVDRHLLFNSVRFDKRHVCEFSVPVVTGRPYEKKIGFTLVGDPGVVPCRRLLDG